MVTGDALAHAASAVAGRPQRAHITLGDSASAGAQTARAVTLREGRRVRHELLHERLAREQAAKLRAAGEQNQRIGILVESAHVQQLRGVLATRQRIYGGLPRSI
jgi:hypothetical protein